MNGRFVVGALVALLIAGGAAVLGVSAYQAGIAQGIAQSADGATSVVVYGAGGAGGFGFGGFFVAILGLLFVLFIVGGIARAIAFRRAGPGRWGGPRGWGGPGHWGGGSEADRAAAHERWRGTPWEARARDIHDEWHRSGGDQSTPVEPAPRDDA